MIVLDTTILVYAVGADHPLASPCRDLVAALGAGEVRATTTLEVLQEFAHVRARRRGRRDAADLVRRFAVLLGPPLELQQHDLDRGMELFTAHDGLGAFDCVLAAAAIRSQAAVVSADSAFEQLPGLRHLHPGSPHFLDDARRLGA